MTKGISYSYFRTRFLYSEEKDLLGTGGFGSVFRVQDTMMNRVVAIKYYKGESSKYDVVNEIKKVFQLDHRNLVKYYHADYIFHKEDLDEESVSRQDQYAVMEYINGGNLNKFLAANKEKIVQNSSIFDNIVLDIFWGLKKLEDEGIIHGDIKPQNILIQEKGNNIIAKISDFGLSRKVGQDLTGPPFIAENSQDKQADKAYPFGNVIMGSPPFIAPELIDPNYSMRDDAGNIIRHSNVDLWAIGVVLYWIFIGEHPFGPLKRETDPKQLLKNISIKSTPDKLDKIPPKYRKVVQRCLIKDASKRVKSVFELINLVSSSRISAKPKIRLELNSNNSNDSKKKIAIKPRKK